MIKTQPNEFRTLIDHLGLQQVDVAKLFAVTDRQTRRWAQPGAKLPRVVAIALSLMIKFNVTPERALKIAGREED